MFITQLSGRELWKQRFIVAALEFVRPVYNPKDLAFRISIDLAVSIVGLSLGFLFTILKWTTRWATTPKSWVLGMIQNYWIPSIPWLILACLVGYFASGLYGVPRQAPNRSRVLAVMRAVGVAFGIYLFIMFLTEMKIPRSTVVVGWFFIFLFMALARLSRGVFLRLYQVVPREETNESRLHREGALSVLFQEEGWIPPEDARSRAPWPCFSQDEIDQVARTLYSGRVNRWTGEENGRFEEEFADYCGVSHAIALANGTVALELALYALGVGPGDEVVVTPRTFVASAGCAVSWGARPVFADVDRESQNITAESIRAVLTARTRAVIAVHLAGWPCDMDGIMTLAREKGLYVVEDCAQAHGALYKNRKVGSFGDMAAFSFCQDKIMTTGGEGGMLLTNREDLWKKAWEYKDHGKNFASVYAPVENPEYRWLHDSFGTNWRMTEMQASIGRLQLRKLPGWLKIRKRNARILTEAFRGVPCLRVPTPPPYMRHSWYKYYVFVRPEGLKPEWSRERILLELNQIGISCFTGSCSEIYREKAFEGTGWTPSERLPTARELGETSLMFLVHPTLSTENMRDTAARACEVLSQ